jgi:hypothetical protein
LKTWKVELEGWSTKPTFAIEDPFETSYDVAHVLKPSTHMALKAEFARAYMLLVAIVMTRGDGKLKTGEGGCSVASLLPPDTPQLVKELVGGVFAEAAVAPLFAGRGKHKQ